MKNIASGKPVHASDGQKTAGCATDGNRHTQWEASQYPAYLQVDLRENYRLKSVTLFTPPRGYTQYSVYGSLDGVDFFRLFQKKTHDACPPCGERFETEAQVRFLRVVVEYASVGTKAVLEQLVVHGLPTGLPVQEPSPVLVPDYEDSPYALPVSERETLHTVQGIIERTVGKPYVSWFSLRLQPNAKHPQYDYFTLEDVKEGVLVTGNSGVSLAAGVNHYLKYYCNVHVAQMGSRLTMPAAPVPVGTVVRRETPFPVRYAYNYCTHAYTMAFWGEEEWQRELDWLALNGVTLVLDITAWEEVWRRFLLALGYSHNEAKDFIAGPAYAPWALMANLSGFGGPVHDSWFLRRTRLARKNQRMMQALGMQPVLQGYNGMVPADIRQKQPGIQVIPQGKWCAFQRPGIVKTTSGDYARLARLFYRCQRQVYGNVTRYYAADMFHEGGFPGLMKQEEVSAAVMRSMLDFQPDSVWVIQSWMKNPTRGLLQGLELYREHTLVLDLQAEKDPRWTYWDGGEFHNSPWVYCMLNNFGGRMGLYGHMKNFVSGIAKAAAQAPLMQGIGITPEATMGNPILYDLFFETVWGEDPDHLGEIHLDDWLRNYSRRRYGGMSVSASRALRILKDSVYNSPLQGDGAPESVINARPSLLPRRAFANGNPVETRMESKVLEAAKLMLSAYDALQASDGYRYDLTDLLRQVLAYKAYHAQRHMAAAYRQKEKNAFQKASLRFLSSITLMDTLLSTRKEFLLGAWLEQAQKAAERTDDFTRDLFAWSARALVTTWGSKEQSETGKLHEYSNRQWAGLTAGFYLKRWQCFTAHCKERLEGKGTTHIDWFPLEWAWVRGKKHYPCEPLEMDLKALAEQIIHF